MYYLSVYVKSFKELFLYCFESYLISQKRVQKYKLFSKPPNISRKKLCFYLIFNSYKQLKTYLSLSTPYNIHTHIACVCRHTGAQAHRRANTHEHACIRIYVRMQIYMMIVPSLYDDCSKSIWWLFQVYMITVSSVSNVETLCSTGWNIVV